jgi:uncharacterized protein involved in response to NO
MMSPAKLWHSFTAAPHRVMFFGGALQTLAVMLWWLIELVTRYGVVGQPIAWSMEPGAAHGFLMIYTLFPFFMFGFLMTTFPRWMNGREIAAPRYVMAFLLLMLGVVGFYVGLWLSHTVLVVALVSMLAGWGVALYALLRVLLDTQRQDKRHAVVIFVALGMGWCGMGAYLIWQLGGSESWLNLALQGGLWLFLLPVFASVGHRMIPFFTGSALPHRQMLRPFWPWPLILGASAAHALLHFAGASAWLWLFDAPLAVAALYLSYSWGLRQALRIPLLGVLHIGFAWLGFALLLSGAQSAVMFFSHGSNVIWGLAPLHALTIGCFATLMLGMATRVTLGHSGLPMKVDLPIRLMFAGIQLAALLRVLADVLPMQAGYWLYFAAAAVWLACFAPWVARYLPAYWRVRADGRAG